jgi:hypothetical protein
MKTGVLGTGTLTNKARLLAAYAAYNRQDSDALLALVSKDVNWPDGKCPAARQGRAACLLDAPVGGDAHPR